MKPRRKSPWIILFMGLLTVGLMMWAMQYAVETVVPVTPLVELGKALRDLYSFEQVTVVRRPAAGDPAALHIRYKVGRSGRTFPSPDAEMLDVAQYARSQFERFQGSWEGITAVEVERTDAAGAVTAWKTPLAGLSPGGRPAPAAPVWKPVWTAAPMCPEAVDKMNRLSLEQGHQPWRLQAFEVARAQLATWLADSGRVETPSTELDQALSEGWEAAGTTNGGPQHWIWKGRPGQFRVTLQPTLQSDGKPGVFLAVRIEEAPGAPATAGSGTPKNTRTVYLKTAGPNTILVVKQVRAHANLGLQEALNLVEKAPCALKSGMTLEAAEKFRKDLEAAGAAAEIR